MDRIVDHSEMRVPSLADAPAAAALGPRHASHADEEILVVSTDVETLELATHALLDVGLRAARCSAIDAACEAIRSEIGVLAIDEAMLATAAAPLLIDAVRDQPAWSDLPVIVFLAEDATRGAPAMLATLAAVASVTVLERPLTQRTLASVAITALRARQRQYEVRDSLEQLGHAESALRRTSERIALVADAIDLGIWYSDLRFGKLAWSDTVRRHFGLRPGAPATVGTFHEHVHPDDRDRTREAFERAIADGTRFDSVFRTVEPASAPEPGRVRWIRAIGHVFGDPGAPVRFDGVTLDVTAEHAATDAAETSRRRYHALADVSAQVTWVTCANGLAEDTPQWRAITGQTSEEVVGLGWLDALHPMDRARVAGEWQRAVAAQSSIDTEFRIRLANGTYRWYRARGAAVRDDDGTVREWVGICFDIDAQKATEVDQQFLLDLGASLYTIRDPQVLVAQALGSVREHLALPCCALADIDVEQGIGVFLPGYGVGAPGSTATCHLRHVPAVHDALLAGEVVVVVDVERDPRTVLSDAERRAFPALRAMVCIPLHRHGRWIAMLTAGCDAPRAWTMREVALLRAASERIWPAVETARALADAECARRAAEVAAERTRLLQELTEALASALTPVQVAQAVMRQGMLAFGAIAGGLCLLTPDGQHMELVAVAGVPGEVPGPWLAFPLTERYPVNDAVVRRDQIFLASVDDWRERYPAMAAQIASYGWQGYAAVPIEIEDRVLGALNYNFAEVRAFSDEDRAFLDAMGRLCAQALERARLYEDERQARRAAVTASRAKSDFLAVMSHELRTPLNAIAGHVQLVEMGIHGPVTEAQRDALGRVQRSQQHLLGLINNVLNLARVESGRVEYAIGDVSLPRAVSEAMPLFTPQLEAKGLEYALLVADESLAVRADPDKLRQVLLNLVTNAIKFTPAGGRVSIECRRARLTSSADRPLAELLVRDTGPGIAPEKCEAIFEPFMQIDRSITRQSEGVGLGLAISRELARGMGGELTVESEVGKGSTFMVTLVAAECEEVRECVNR